MGTRYWSLAGAHFDEMVATKLPVKPWFPAAAMEQADRKSLRPLPIGSKFRSIADVQF
jgi:hypothetical protein